MALFGAPRTQRRLRYGARPIVLPPTSQYLLQTSVELPMLRLFQTLRILDRLSAVILRVYQPRDTVPSTADGIIGIGIGLRADGEPSPMSAAVAKKCVDLYIAGVANRIVFTGGYQRNGTTEAEAMASVARRLGVPESALIIENKSRRTHLNALLTKPIVVELGWRSLILVAQNVHARRALAIFRRLYGPEYTFYFAAAKSKYELLPQRRLSSEPRFLLTWELPSFLLAKIRGWA